jgi:hypothetical protein
MKAQVGAFLDPLERPASRLASIGAIPSSQTPSYVRALSQ